MEALVGLGIAALSAAFAWGGAWAGVRYAIRDLRDSRDDHERRLRVLEGAWPLR